MLVFRAGGVGDVFLGGSIPVGWEENVGAVGVEKIGAGDDRSAATSTLGAIVGAGEERTIAVGVGTGWDSGVGVNDTC